jgi:hypothetical protein
VLVAIRRREDGEEYHDNRKENDVLRQQVPDAEKFQNSRLF